MIIAIVYLDYHHFFIINIIILPQAAPLGAAAAAAELTRLFPGRKLPELMVWRSLRGNFDVLFLSDYFCLYSQGLGLNLRLSARTCVRSSQSSTKWVESTLCQDPSTWEIYSAILCYTVSGSFHLATRTFLAMQIYRNISTTKTTSYTIMQLSRL